MRKPCNEKSGGHFFLAWGMEVGKSQKNRGESACCSSGGALTAFSVVCFLIRNLRLTQWWVSQGGQHRTIWIACTLVQPEVRSSIQALQAGGKGRKLPLSSYCLAKQTAYSKQSDKAKAQGLKLLWGLQSRDWGDWRGIHNPCFGCHGTYSSQV